MKNYFLKIFKCENYPNYGTLYTLTTAQVRMQHIIDFPLVAITFNRNVTTIKKQVEVLPSKNLEPYKLSYCKFTAMVNTYNDLKKEST